MLRWSIEEALLPYGAVILRFGAVGLARHIAFVIDTPREDLINAILIGTIRYGGIGEITQFTLVLLNQAFIRAILLGTASLALTNEAFIRTIYQGTAIGALLGLTIARISSWAQSLDWCRLNWSWTVFRQLWLWAFNLCHKNWVAEFLFHWFSEFLIQWRWDIFITIWDWSFMFDRRWTSFNTNRAWAFVLGWPWDRCRTRKAWRFVLHWRWASLRSFDMNWARVSVLYWRWSSYWMRSLFSWRRASFCILLTYGWIIHYWWSSYSMGWLWRCMLDWWWTSFEMNCRSR